MIKFWILLIMLISTNLFPQFEYLTTITKENSADVFVGQQLFDVVKGNQSEEVCIGIREHNGTWKIVFFDNYGLLKGEISGDPPPYGTYGARKFVRFQFLYRDNQTYLLLLFSGGDVLMFLRLYRYPDLELVDELTTSDYPYQTSHGGGFDFHLFNTRETSSIIAVLGLDVYASYSSGSTNTGWQENYLILFALEADTLRRVNLLEDYLYYFPESDLCLGEEYSWSSPSNSEPRINRQQYFLGLSSFTNSSQHISQKIGLNGYWLQYRGYQHFPSNLQYISKTNSNSSNHGSTFYYHEQDSIWSSNIFVHYDDNLAFKYWERTDSNLDLANGISASSTFLVDGRDHFIIYFAEQEYEIRDLLTGDIVLTDTTSIQPTEILIDKTSNRFFFEETEQAIDLLVNRAGVITGTSISEVPALPSTITLSANYPNPFNPTTTIEFQLPVASRVTLEIFNVMGQRIARAYRDTPLRAGAHTYGWDATDDSGNPVASGVYFYRLTAGDFQQVRKMLLVR